MDNNLSTQNKQVVIKIPEFGPFKEMVLSRQKITEGNERLIEARVVNPATYTDLEFAFNEGYREARANIRTVNYEITKLEKHINQIKSRLLIDEYVPFLKETKLKDSNVTKDAFFQQCEEYVQSVDRLNFLQAVSQMFEDNVKVFERTCAYMKKEMNLVLRSGIDPNKYVR